MNRRIREGLRTLSSSNKSKSRRIVQDPKCQFLKLPDELILKVFQFLDVNTLIKLTYVCTKCKRLSEDTSLWQQKYINYVQTIKTNGVKLKEAAMPYKDRLLQITRKTRDKMALRKSKVNQYTGVCGNIDRFLWEFGIQFQLCLITKDDTKHAFTQTYRKSFSSSTVLQWNSLDNFPKWSNVKRVELYARVPLMFGSKERPLKGSPKQLSLMSKDTTAEVTNICSDKEIQALLLRSGLLVVLWKNSSDVAFFCTAIHHNDVVKKLIYSKVDETYYIPHRIILDDVDRFYGLHGYKCHVHLHTLGWSIFEEKFSGLFCDEAQNATVEPVKDFVKLNVSSVSTGVSNKLEMDWKTDLFQGTLPNTAMLDVTLVDINSQVMWPISSPVQSTEQEITNGVFDVRGINKVFKYSDNVGEISVCLNIDGDRVKCKEVEIWLNVQHINQWFGTSY